MNSIKTFAVRSWNEGNGNIRSFALVVAIVAMLLYPLWG